MREVKIKKFSRASREICASPAAGKMGKLLKKCSLSPKIKQIGTVFLKQGAGPGGELAPGQRSSISVDFGARPGIYMPPSTSVRFDGLGEEPRGARARGARSTRVTRPLRFAGECLYFDNALAFFRVNYCITINEYR